MHPLAPGMRAAGPARTLRFVPFRPDLYEQRGGAAFVPDDWIVGDADGVIVIPAALLDELLADAERQELEDAWVAERASRTQ